MPRRIGITGTILGAPFVEALKRRSASVPEFVSLPPQQLAEQLRQGNLDGAFVSPWEYAACYPTHRIVPAAAAVSEGASGLIALVYREHARRLERIAARPEEPAERALAQIVLAEKYDTHPEFHEFGGSWQEALKTADAVLISDALALEAGGVEARLDLVDEWQDLTELPYVHGFWVVRDEVPYDWDAFTPPDPTPPRTVRTVPADADWDGLREFYRMAYYHGIINDLPDLRFSGAAEEPL